MYFSTSHYTNESESFAFHGIAEIHLGKLKPGLI